MRILVIAQRFPPDVGGACTRVYNAVKGLQKLGHKLVIIAAFPRDRQGNTPRRYRNSAFDYEEHGNDVKLFRVWIPPLLYRGLEKRFLMFLSFIVSALFPLPLVGRVDIVWAANPNFFSMFPAIIYSRIYGAPIVRNVDDLWPEVVYDLGYVKSALFKKLLNFIAKITYMIPKAITPISRSYKKAIVDRYNLDENRVFVIEHGVDNRLFHPIPLEDNKYGASFIVMYSGKLGIAYDFDVVLETARHLSSIDDIKFVIRGFGERMGEIKSKTAEYGLTNVILDTDFVDIKELKTILNSAHVFILPMKPLEAPEQGLPTKILEYQACGKPIICCSRGEAARYISLTESGLAIEPGDPQALASAILELYNDKESLQELGSNGWKHVSQNLTIEKIGERINDAFLEARTTHA